MGRAVGGEAGAQAGLLQASRKNSSSGRSANTERGRASIRAEAGRVSWAGGGLVVEVSPWLHRELSGDGRCVIAQTGTR